ncbi:MAG TPA: hypothetical protein DD638_05785 [Pasteurellaceae bacterium]|nr:hypothetical protein [Pasteurellaceae bacterium]
MILRRNKYKGMSPLSLLITMSIFSGIFLSVNQWTSHQRSSAVEIYQRFQAVQIAENQKQRGFLGLPCQSSVEQNQLKFQVRCLNDKVMVTYPRGEINL